MPQNADRTKTRRQHDSLFAQHDPLRVRYARSELICQEGSYAAGMYVIESGLVSESMPPPISSDNKPYKILGPGELIGVEILLLGDSERHITSCRALVDTELSFVERSSFMSALEADAQLCRFVLGSVSAKSFALASSLCRSGSAPAERLCALLLELADAHGERSECGDTTLPHAITRNLLCALASLSSSQLKAAWDALPSLREKPECGGIAVSARELAGWQQARRPS